MKNLVISLINFFGYYLNDYLYMVKYSLSSPFDSKDRMLARIMLVMHALEKGMSFPKDRIFGEEKANTLAIMLEKYLTKYKCNNICIIALNVLSEYLKQPNSTDNQKIRKKISTLLQKYKENIVENYAGVKKVTGPFVFNKKEIESFYKSRASIRDFSNVIVSDEEIKSALKIATTTPSACNRQTCRVHAYRDKVLIDKILDNQLGNQGWANKATILFIITSNTSYFNCGYERYQAFIDGGLFAMNFDMGLHLNNIASCFKMYIRTPQMDKKFRKICNIPDNEIPIVLILAGHYPSYEITSPKSVRISEYNPFETLVIHKV